jgi:hypothetical protein
MLLRLICHRNGITLSVAIYNDVSVCTCVRKKSCSWIPERPTSAVSRTLITPGWRKVRSFFRAFRARGSRDLLAPISKENILQLDPSSCSRLLATRHANFLRSLHVAVHFARPRRQPRNPGGRQKNRENWGSPKRLPRPQHS